MRAGFGFLVGALIASTLVAPAVGQSTDDAFVHRRMTSAGFIPLEEMTFGNRDVRRVLPIDPYFMLPIPGIELERHIDGRLTLRAQYRSWTGAPYSVSPVEWERLMILESAAFAPPGKNSFKAEPGVVVHCWSGLLEASPQKASSWWGCNSGTKAAQAYTEAVLVLAMQKKECTESERDTLWRFSECFAVSQLDDPALQERLAALRERWTIQREPGSDILGKARLALRAARENPMPSRIAEAREAVFAFGRQQDALREILQSSFRALPSSDDLVGKNAAILDQIRRGWRQDIEAQNDNYIELLENLTRLSAVIAEPSS